MDLQDLYSVLSKPKKEKIPSDIKMWQFLIAENSSY